MANGFHGTKEKWEALEAPLRSLDGELRAFADRYQGALSTNGRGWPERSIVWDGPIRRLMQIYVADEERAEYSFWICASEDRGSERYWRQEYLWESAPLGEMAGRLSQLLEQGRSLLEGWTSEDLEFATTLGSPPPSGVS
jgi:hypothetical protein